MSRARRSRTVWAAVLVAATTVTVGATASATAHADVPEHVVDSMACQSDASGSSVDDWFAPVSGVVAFQVDPPFTMVAFTGTDVEQVDGVTYARVEAGAQYELTLSGPPSTSCVVSFSTDALPANDSLTAPETIAGRTGSVEGTNKGRDPPGRTGPHPRRADAGLVQLHADG